MWFAAEQRLTWSHFYAMWLAVTHMRIALLLVGLRLRTGCAAIESSASAWLPLSDNSVGDALQGWQDANGARGRVLHGAPHRLLKCEMKRDEVIRYSQIQYCVM